MTFSCQKWYFFNHGNTNPITEVPCKIIPVYLKKAVVHFPQVYILLTHSLQKKSECHLSNILML